MEAIRKFFDLLPSERLIFAQAWVLFLLAELALRTIPFKRLIALSQKRCAKREMGETSPEDSSLCFPPGLASGSGWPLQPGK